MFHLVTRSMVLSATTVCAGNVVLSGVQASNLGSLRARPVGLDF